MSENLNLKTIQTIDPSPFKHLCVTIGELPSTFLESMSYYELLAWFVNYLENTVIPAVNANGEATAELQEMFIELKTFVDTYFDNLDVQEEINNKLDEMAEDGTLQEIITTYIQANVAWTFDTVADMKLATNLVSGSYAKTLGYHTLNDGGGAIYYINTNDTANEADIIAIDDTLKAHIVPDNEINIKQFGCYGDGTHDDTTSFGYVLTYANTYNIPVYVPSGTFLVSNEFDINFSLNLHGAGKNTSFIKQTDITKNILIIPYTNCQIKDICFMSLENSSVSQIQIKASTGHNFGNVIDNCEFRGENHTGYGIELICTSTYGIMDTTVSNCIFRQLTNGIRFNIGTGWINGNYFSNLWIYTTVNGIEWADTNSYKSCGLNKFDSIKGQYSSGVSNSLIYNVNGSNNTFSDIHLWDGGITIQIGYHARYTKIKNEANFEIAKFIDYGWHTEVDTFYGDLARPHYIEKNLTFLTDTEGLSARTSNGNEATVGVVSNNTACSVATVATTDDAIALQGSATMNGTSKQMINFSFRVDNTSNIKLYLGLSTTTYAQRQGNFLTFDTSVDLHPTLKAISNEGSGTYGGTLAIPDFTLNTNWHKVQIWRNTDQRLDVWIDGNYIGGFNASQKYPQALCFQIITLDDVVKTLSIGQVRVRNYVY